MAEDLVHEGENPFRLHASVSGRVNFPPWEETILVVHSEDSPRGAPLDQNNNLELSIDTLAAINSCDGTVEAWAPPSTPVVRTKGLKLDARERPGMLDSLSPVACLQTPRQDAGAHALCRRKQQQRALDSAQRRASDLTSLPSPDELICSSPLSGFASGTNESEELCMADYFEGAMGMNRSTASGSEDESTVGENWLSEQCWSPIAKGSSSQALPPLYAVLRSVPTQASLGEPKELNFEEANFLPASPVESREVPRHRLSPPSPIPLSLGTEWT